MGKRGEPINICSLGWYKYTCMDIRLELDQINDIRHHLRNLYPAHLRALDGLLGSRRIDYRSGPIFVTDTLHITRPLDIFDVLDKGIQTPVLRAGCWARDIYGCYHINMKRSLCNYIEQACS